MRYDYEQLSPFWRGNLHSLLARGEKLERRYGLSWYSDARSTCWNISQKLNFKLETVVGVLAALSPGNPWLRNVREAEEFLTLYKGQGRKIKINRYKFGVYGRKNKFKALAIAEGDDPRDILGGKKVRAFYECILNPQSRDFVTIDGHAKCAAYNQRLGIHLVTVRPAEYQHLAEAYSTVAEEVGLIPSQAQAIIWLTWRRMHGVEWLPDERQLELI